MCSCTYGLCGCKHVGVCVCVCVCVCACVCMYSSMVICFNTCVHKLVTACTQIIHIVYVSMLAECVNHWNV